MAAGRGFTQKETAQVIRAAMTFGAIALGILIADQITKYLIAVYIPLNGGLEVVPGYLNLVHVRNPGGAFGILADSASATRFWFFVGISVVALGVIIWMVLSSTEPAALSLTSYSLFFGGALGNLFDRIRFREVIDFLDFHLGTLHWPAFNVADSALCVGVGLFLLHLVKTRNS
jgi:signal peptidase II